MPESLPLNLFALVRDPLLVKEIILRHYPAARFDATDADWTRAEIVEKRLLIGSKPVLTVNHDPSYYAEPNWSEQLNGMAGYFSQGEPNERQQIITSQIIPKFTFSVACLFHRTPREPDLAFLSELSSSLKGFIFDGSQLMDATGRCILDTDGNSDPEASFPQEFYEPPEGNPVSSEQAAARVLAVAAVVLRSVLERDLDSLDDPPALHQRLLAWVESCSLAHHLEPEKAAHVSAVPGTLEHQQVIDGLWQVEGLELLLWALGKRDLARLTALSDVDTPLGLAGVLRKSVLPELISPGLRPLAELEQQQAVQLAVHWRLREYGLRPGKLDFPEFVASATFGPLSLIGVPLAENDLALDGHPLHTAPEQLTSIATSMARERHRAINWLMWGGGWVHTDTAT